ncbi:MAG TPA: hypothetical protein VFU32_12005 [Ktedonobacterales bacterium]|nr:hypothetical protein [Ktedonobacterales bacterium]
MLAVAGGDQIKRERSEVIAVLQLLAQPGQQRGVNMQHRATAPAEQVIVIARAGGFVEALLSQQMDLAHQSHRFQPFHRAIDSREADKGIACLDTLADSFNAEMFPAVLNNTQHHLSLWSQSKSPAAQRLARGGGGVWHRLLSLHFLWFENMARSYAHYSALLVQHGIDAA